MALLFEAWKVVEIGEEEDDVSEAEALREKLFSSFEEDGGDSMARAETLETLVVFNGNDGGLTAGVESFDSLEVCLFRNLENPIFACVN
ncbi:hypothetical protein WICPIJ_009457 [Wickerhamomyces pijperi]|uniref:Uncharacterized protein n=1 Tax=Wickerhamomyces pijperi TaxID=599730 RepID=A0A9P8PNS8_WICPI|nr:hypothetical protein WICPIJ_009457 [Wickerhamomyces pijperi]